MAFRLGAAVPGLDRLRAGLIVLCGTFVVVDALIWTSIDGA